MMHTPADINRFVAIPDGVAMVVTDIHGDWDAYERLRDLFLEHRARGEAQRLVLCGDLIHGYGTSAEDASLPIVLDVMRLQAELGSDVVIVLLGNHEMPHIYGVTLSKGDIEFTSRFEHALSQLDANPQSAQDRSAVLAFFMSLPFYAYTPSGVLLTHAGAPKVVRVRADGERLRRFDHRAILRAFSEQIAEWPLLDSLRHNPQYLAQARHYLAISGTEDSRFTDLLRANFISENSKDFHFLWDTLFTTNENGHFLSIYALQASVFLSVMSVLCGVELRAIVAGHLPARDGYALVGVNHLRLASYAHSQPKRAGRYLLLDCVKPVSSASALVSSLRYTFPP